MIYSLSEYISVYFNDSIPAFSEQSGIDYQKCVRRAKNPAYKVLVTPTTMRLFKEEMQFSPRTYDVAYDHFNPTFLRFSFNSRSYVVSKAIINPEIPYLVEPIDNSGRPVDVYLVHSDSELSNFQSLCFKEASQHIPVMECVFDSFGVFEISHQPQHYILTGDGDQQMDTEGKMSFTKALEYANQNGLVMSLGSTDIYRPSSDSMGSIV